MTAVTAAAATQPVPPHARRGDAGPALERSEGTRRHGDAPPRISASPRPRVPASGKGGSGAGAGRPPDYALLLVIAALLAFGLIMVYSASVVTAYTAYRNQYFFLTKQSVSAAIGLGAMVVLMRLDYHALRAVSVPGLIAAIALLAAVLVLGSEAYGAQRWLVIFGFPLQPSEFAKLAVTIYLAHWLTTKREQVRDLAHGFVPFVLLVALLTGLLLKQPDLGTAFVIAALATSVFFAAGAHLAQLAVLALAVVLALVPLIRLAPYRMERFLAFVDPWARPQATGYHVVQALLALGAGGVTGVGLGVGRQKFMYLPFPHTDSVFAVIGEELGLAGTLGVLAAFVVFAYRGLRIAWYAPDQLGRLLATGVTCGIVFQAMTNMAVLTSSVPFTGITLPFLSYGGSSLVTTLASCGVLLSVSRQIVPPQSAGAGPTADAHGRPASRPDRWRRYRRPHLPGFGRRAGLAGRAG